MRLRQRRPRALGEGWLRPRASGRWTTVGNLDSGRRAAVDPAGLVTIDGATWSLDWWVGAEDRWHLPCQEVAVRQALVGSSPVVETRLRVPSGDAIQRAYAARDRSGNEAVVVEIENASTVPFAVALALRPHGQDDRGAIGELALDERLVRVDGVPALVLPKPPGRAALSTGADGDCAQVVLAGDAPEVRSAAVRCRDGLAQGAVLFPLAHTARLRVVLPLEPAGAPPEPDAFPGPTDVATGWGTQSARGARLEVPDRRLRDAVLASTRHLLLAERTAATATALDLLGFHAEVARWLRAEALTPSRSDRPGAALAAIARHWELTRDAVTAAETAPWIGALVATLARTDPDDRDTGHAAMPALVAALDAAGEPRAAEDLRRILATAAVAPVTPDPAAELRELLGAATGTWTWPGGGSGHDPAANARLVTAVRRQLLEEDPGGLRLSPSVPEAWLGQGWEVHDLPTTRGLLSYAVRWHGDRPALLWQLDARAGAEAPRLSAPSLDPAWSSDAAEGEALLAPVVLPERAPRRGITMPVTIEPMPKRAT